MSYDTMFEHFRLLQDTNSSSSSNSTSSSKSSPNDSQTLRDTFMVYGSLLIVFFLLFCWARQKFPRPYTIRKWVESLKTVVAQDQFGFFSWTWKLNTITDDEIMTECGMDSLCFLRLLRMGYKICLVGVFNSIWLMPLYATAEEAAETAYINDRVVEISVSNVPASSPRLVGTALATYMLFGYIMYLIITEFEWFTEQRHKFLKLAKPQNYSVFVYNIPVEYRSNAGLEDFFKQSFSSNAVLEARVRVKAPKLAKEVAKRKSIIAKLEHAIAYEDLKGEAPKHSSRLVGGVKVLSIPTYTEELKDMNADIAKRIEAIEAIEASTAIRPAKIISSDLETQRLLSDGAIDASEAGMSGKTGLKDKNADKEHQNDSDSATEKEDAPNDNIFGWSKNALASGTTALSSGAATLTKGASALSKGAATLITGSEDGEMHEAGFVTFTSLSTTQAALQVVHDAQPFAMSAAEAPDPEDIFWANVGRTHKDLEVGKLFSLAATTAVCFLWTIPMAFFASLSSVDGLRKIDFINEMLDKLPWLEPVLAQLAPFLVIIVNSLLPTILQIFSKLEGPVSGSVVEASTFSKLAAFMIIQTFFVSALTGGLITQLTNMINDPTQIINLLATSLPQQSTYFMQISFVGTVMMVGLEILRVTPLVFAFIRRFVGPNLTEKERQTTFFIFRPLADPSTFGISGNFAQLVLYFLIVMVYQVIAPLTSFIMGFCFFFMAPAFRHQFVYIYPTLPDSGGKIWTNFIKIMMLCMLIAEFTILGLLALKKAASAVPFMVPLIIVTILFNAYVRQQHFRVAEFLPSRECLKADSRSKSTGFDPSSMKGAYLQEELREKEAFPDVAEERSSTLGLVPTETSSNDLKMSSYQLNANTNQLTMSSEVATQASSEPQADAPLRFV